MLIFHIKSLTFPILLYTLVVMPYLIRLLVYQRFLKLYRRLSKKISTPWQQEYGPRKAYGRLKKFIYTVVKSKGLQLSFRTLLTAYRTCLLFPLFKQKNTGIVSSYNQVLRAFYLDNSRIANFTFHLYTGYIWRYIRKRSATATF